MGRRQGLVKAAGGAVAAAVIGLSGSALAVPHVSVSGPGDAPAHKKKHGATHSSHASHEEAVVRHDPEAAAKLKEEADSLRSQGKLEEAAKTYEQAYRRDDSNIALVEDYGRTLYSLSRYREAAEVFKKAASEQEPAAYWNLGYALRKVHDYDGAAKAYLQYIKNNPDDPDGWYSIAECYRAMGNKQDAITAYDAYAQKETRASEQSWVEKAKKKSEALSKALAAAAAPPVTVAMAAPPPIVAAPVVAPEPAPAPVVAAAPVPAPAPVVVAAPAPAPVVVAAPAPVVVAAPVPAPVVVAAPAPAPVVVAPAPAPAPVVVAAPAPAPAPVVVAAPAPVVVAAPAPAPVVAAPVPAPVAAVPSGPARDTNAAMARVREGDAAFQQKQYNEALAAYQDAVKLDDQSAAAYLKMGLAYANLSRFQEAIDQWQHVLKLDPDNRYAPKFIAKAQSHLSGTAAPVPAVVATPTVAAPTPVVVATGHAPTDDETAAYRRGLQALREAHYQESLAEFTSVIDKNPTYVNAFVARGRAYAGSHDYASAIGDYLHALSLNPNMATPVFGLAQAYDKQGAKSAACENYRKYVDSTAPDVQGKLKDMAQAALATCGP